MTLTAGNLVLTSTPDPIHNGDQQPSLDLRFAESKTLNDALSATPLVDHQRSMSGSNLSAGTFVNSSGLIETAKVNLVSYSQEFENSYYTKANITTMQATTDVAAPDGTFTARYISGASNGRFTISSSNFTSQLGRRKSIYLRAVSGSPVVNALTQAATDPNPVTLSSTEWLRFEIDTPSSEVGGTTFVLDFRGSSTTTEVYAWGLQIEEGSAATTYIPTTNVPSAAPRFDHDPTTGESLGLLIEESRENLIANSEDLTGWGSISLGDGVNPVAANITSTTPDNGSTATKVTLSRNTATTNNYSIYRILCTHSNVVNTGSLYIKAFSASDVGKVVDVYINQGSPLDFQTVTLTDEWQRITSIGTIPTTQSFLNVALYNSNVSAGTVNVLIWGAQVETGSFATSYIPTSGTALTRSADEASITGANFSSWYNQSEGSIYAESNAYNLSSLSALFSANDGSFSNRITSTPLTYGLFIATNNAVQVSINAGGFWNSGQVVKAGFGIAANDFSVVLDGSTLNTDNSGSIPVVNRLNIGRNAGNTSPWNGTISRLTYYPYRLADTRLQSLTA